MGTPSYPQFCALARAAELLGERWTLLIVRELLVGPKRFTDLRARLDDISTSVLAERLTRLEAAGLIRSALLEAPAASTVYELTAHGRALEPAIFALIRWGARFLWPARQGERLDPDWAQLALAAFARKGRAPRHAYEIRMPGKARDAVIYAAGSSRGTIVTKDPRPVELTITGGPETILGLMAGLTHPTQALREGTIHIKGDRTILGAFPRLFDVSAARHEASAQQTRG